MGVLETCKFIKTYNAIHEGKMVLSSKPDSNTATGTYFQSVTGRKAKQDRTQHMLYTVHVTEMHSCEIVNEKQKKESSPRIKILAE